MEKIKTLQNVALYSVSPLNPKQNLLFLLFVSFIILSLLSLILILFSDWLMLENAPHKYLKKRVFWLNIDICLVIKSMVERGSFSMKQAQ